MSRAKSIIVGSFKSKQRCHGFLRLGSQFAVAKVAKSSHFLKVPKNTIFGRFRVNLLSDFEKKRGFLFLKVAHGEKKRQISSPHACFNG